MPAQHSRRPFSRLTRICVAAGTGSVVIALPIMGAAAAQASTPAAEKAAAPVTATAAVSAPVVKVAKKTAAGGTYEVVSGDYLSKIADEHKVSGGWQSLYDDNRDVVGDNPELIYPGQKLTLDGKPAAKPSAPAKPSKPAEKPAAKAETAKPAPKAETAAPKADTAERSTEAKANRSSDRAESAQTGNSSGWVKPVDASASTAYRASGSSWSSGYHTGTDFSASAGTTVKAIGQGTVVSAGWGGSYGNEVVIKHSDGRYSQYAHMSSLSVSTGETVSGGQQIGLVGSTGNSTGPHLHFEVRTGPGYGSDINPTVYLRSHGVRL